MTTTRQDGPTTKPPHFATLLVMALDSKEIGSRISKRRAELGWTHQRLADEMGVALRTAQRWQEGVDAEGKSLLPRLGTLMDLADKMEVERSYFVEDHEDGPQTQGDLLRGVAAGVQQLERSAEDVLKQLDDVVERLRTIEGAVLPPPGSQSERHQS